MSLFTTFTLANCRIYRLQDSYPDISVEFGFNFCLEMDWWSPKRQYLYVGAPLYANHITLTTQAVWEDVRQSIQHLYAAIYCRNYPPNCYNLPCSAQTLLRNVPHTSDNPVFLTKYIPSKYLHHTLHGITPVFSCHRTWPRARMWKPLNFDNLFDAFLERPITSDSFGFLKTLKDSSFSKNTSSPVSNRNCTGRFLTATPIMKRFAIRLTPWAKQTSFHTDSISWSESLSPDSLDSDCSASFPFFLYERDSEVLLDTS